MAAPWRFLPCPDCCGPCEEWADLLNGYQYDEPTAPDEPYCRMDDTFWDWDNRIGEFGYCIGDSPCDTPCPLPSGKCLSTWGEETRIDTLASWEKPYYRITLQYGFSDYGQSARLYLPQGYVYEWGPGDEYGDGWAKLIGPTGDVLNELTPADELPTLYLQGSVTIENIASCFGGSWLRARNSLYFVPAAWLSVGETQPTNGPVGFGATTEGPTSGSDERVYFYDFNIVEINDSKSCARAGGCGINPGSPLTDLKGYDYGSPTFARVTMPDLISAGDGFCTNGPDVGATIDFGCSVLTGDILGYSGLVGANRRFAVCRNNQYPGYAYGLCRCQVRIFVDNNDIVMECYYTWNYSTTPVEPVKGIKWRTTIGFAGSWDVCNLWTTGQYVLPFAEEDLSGLDHPVSGAGTSVQVAFPERPGIAEFIPNPANTGACAGTCYPYEMFTNIPIPTTFLMASIQGAAVEVDDILLSHYACDPNGWRGACLYSNFSVSAQILFGQQIATGNCLLNFYMGDPALQWEITPACRSLPSPCGLELPYAPAFYVDPHPDFIGSTCLISCVDP